MNNLDLRTPIIYVLTFVIVVLLIVLKKQDDANKNNALKEKLEQVLSLIHILTLPTSRSV